MNTAEIKRRIHAQLAQLQSLEARKMFAAVPRELVDVLHQDLWDVAYEAARGRKDELVDAGGAKVDEESRVQTYLYSDEPSRVFTELQAMGGVRVAVGDIDDAGRRVQAWIPAVLVDEAAALPGVTEAMLPDYFISNVTSAGDALLKVDKVRSTFVTPVLPANINGTGVKIGVISDGANGAASVAAELGTYTINPSLPGVGNEGTAMMEIVHDLAPGAQLYFSGPSTSVDMVNSITYLRNQGCSVIVDDLSFFAEHYFSDTSVAQAAQTAVNNNVVYVTSAGNSGDQEHFQKVFSGNTPGFKPGSFLLNWAGLNTVNNAITIPGGATAIINLQWSDAYGASANDYNLYLADDGFSLVKSAVFVQNGNDNPFEQIVYKNPNAGAKTYYINVEKTSAALNREIEMTVFNNSSMQYSTPGNALSGQEAVLGVMSVAAQNAGSSSVASYSSRGGSTVYSNFATQTFSIRQSLDGTAIDGVNTAIGPVWGHQPFYGTSAAAPHAAAIAGLIRQANPSLTPAQVVQIMADTATDYAAYGAGYDTTSGAGLYNALDAVYKAYTPTAPDLVAASDSNISTDNITNDTTPTFTGTVPAASFVTVFVDGVANGTQQLGAGATTYSITTGVLTNASHNITIEVASSSAVLQSNFSFASSALNVTIDSVAPAAPTAPDLVTADDTGSSNSDNITNKNQPIFSTIGEANSTVSLLAGGVAVGLATSAGVFNIAPTLPLADGSYSITVRATDLAGNVGAASAALNPVKIDTVAPVTNTPIYDPNSAAMTVKVGFSENVFGALSNASLQVQNIATSQLIPAAKQSFAYDAVNNVASFTFVPGFPTKGILLDGDYNAAMYATNVTDVAGNHPALDGTLNFFFFQADANFDRTINALDFNAIAANYGQPNKNYGSGDFNYDGAVDTMDFTILSNKFASTLPLPAPVLLNVPLARAAAPPVAQLFADGDLIDHPTLDNLAL